MLARFGDLGGLSEAGRENGIELSEGDVRLAEIAILKKAYRLIKEGGYVSKLLPCSLRIGPCVEGSLRSWHMEEITGADMVVTVPPFYVEEVVNFPSPESIQFVDGRIDVDPPKPLLDRLMRVPYFERAYTEEATRVASTTPFRPRQDRGGILSCHGADGRVRAKLLRV